MKTYKDRILEVADETVHFDRWSTGASLLHPTGSLSVGSRIRIDHMSLGKKLLLVLLGVVLLVQLLLVPAKVV